MSAEAQFSVGAAALWTLLCVAGAALISALLLIVLRQLQLRQRAYEDAPASHQVKTGTPTMGGIVFLLPLLVTWPLLHGADNPAFYALSFLVACCAAIGFIDDYMSIIRGRNLGLRGRTKYLATTLVAIIFLRWIGDSTQIFPRDVLFHAGSLILVAPHWIWFLLGIVAITGTIHAVNLTDGLDGLATGTIVPPLLLLWFISTSAGSVGLPNSVLAVLLLAVVGTCIGFLFYNRHPAKMFMGDTGSLALGAMLSGAAILTGEMLLLILIGGVFVAEALSVIIQVAYFKRTKKRIFLMSPLHHHFELAGWPETKVTTRFWTASAALSLLGLAIVR